MKLKTKSKQQLLNLFQFFRISESGPFPFKTSNFTCPPPPIISHNTHETDACRLPQTAAYISNQRYTPSAINEAILTEQTKRFIEDCHRPKNAALMPNGEKRGNSSRTRTNSSVRVKSEFHDISRRIRKREYLTKEEAQARKDESMEAFYKNVLKRDPQVYYSRLSEKDPSDSVKEDKAKAIKESAKAEKDSKEQSDYIEEFFKSILKPDDQTKSNQDNQEYVTNNNAHSSSKENGQLNETHKPKKDKPAKDLKRVKVKGIAAEFFDEAVKPKKRKVSATFKPKTSSTTSKPPLTVPNLIVNTLLNDVIDSIVNTKLEDSATAKADLDDNDDNESLESGEILSLEADEIFSDEDLNHYSPNKKHHKSKHTCKDNSSKPCPECIQFKFTGSKKFGPFGRFYNASCQYEIGFDLEISNEIYHLLQRKRVSMKLFNLTEDDKDCKFKINQKYVKFEDISNHDIVSIKFFSSYDPE